MQHDAAQGRRSGKALLMVIAIAGLMLLTFLGEPVQAEQVRIPLTKDGSATEIPAQVDIRLVDANGTPVLGFHNGWQITEYRRQQVTGSDLIVDLAPQSEITTESQAPTWYQIQVKAGRATANYRVQVPVSAELLELEALVGAEAIPPGDINAGRLIPPGGDAGQLLGKESATDFDVTWITASGLGDMLAAVYDPQAIAADAFLRTNHTGTQTGTSVTIAGPWSGNLVEPDPGDVQALAVAVDALDLGGGGDMLAAVYDPQAIAADAFLRTNHTGTQTGTSVTIAGPWSGNLVDPDPGDVQALAVAVDALDLGGGGGGVWGTITGTLSDQLDLQAALDAKPDEPADDANPKLRKTSAGVSSWTDSGGAALLDVGTNAGTVASGDAPAAAVTAHEAAGDPHTQYHTDARGDVRYATGGTQDTHSPRTDNPHGVTKAQVGLGNADNTSDADKPVSTAQQAALDLKCDLAGCTFTGDINLTTANVIADGGEFLSYTPAWPYDPVGTEDGGFGVCTDATQERCGGLVLMLDPDGDNMEIAFGAVRDDMGVRLRSDTYAVLDAANVLLKTNTVPEIRSRVIVAGVTVNGAAILAYERPPTDNDQETGILETDTDLGSGTGTGPWTDLITLPALGQDYAAALTTVTYNMRGANTSSRATSIEVGIRIDGADPTAWNTHPLGTPSTDTPISAIIYPSADLPSGTVLTLTARRVGSHNQSNATVVASVAEPAEFGVYLTATGGGGGGEANIGANLPGGMGVYSGKSGLALQFRPLGNTADLTWSLNGDVIEGTVTLGLGEVSAPTDETDVCTKGQWAWDGVYLYRCIDINSWVRHIVERAW